MSNNVDLYNDKLPPGENLIGRIEDPLATD